jgi:hypothetical protein
MGKARQSVRSLELPKLNNSAVPSGEASALESEIAISSREGEINFR